MSNEDLQQKIEEQRERASRKFAEVAAALGETDALTTKQREYLDNLNFVSGQIAGVILRSAHLLQAAHAEMAALAVLVRHVDHMDDGAPIVGNAEDFFSDLGDIARAKDIAENGPNPPGVLRSLDAVTLTMNEILLALRDFMS